MQRMDRWDAIFDRSNVQQSGFLIDLVPPQAPDFRDSQSMSIYQQDQGGVTVTVTADTARGPHELVDFG